ncbi:PGA27 Predicted GPI-anchored protein 27 [Candida maltosa Xu316]
MKVYQQMRRYRHLIPHTQQKLQIKETRPLIEVSKDGVPLNYHKVTPVMVIKSNNSDPIVVTKTITIVKSEPTNEYTLQQIEPTAAPAPQINKVDALKEIKRLEKLLLNLKEEVASQEETFKKEFMKYYSPKFIERQSSKLTVTSTESSFSTTSTIPTTTHHPTNPIDKNNPKDIWNQKNPPNSVLIVPQFKSHDRSTTITNFIYSKPTQIIWTNFPTTTPQAFYESNGFLFRDRNSDGSSDEVESEQENTSGTSSEEDEEEEVEEVEDDEMSDGSEPVESEDIFHDARIRITTTRTFEDPFETSQTSIVSIITTTSSHEYTYPTSTSRKRKPSMFNFHTNHSVKFDVFDWIFENKSSNANSLKVVLVFFIVEVIFLCLI